MTCPAFIITQATCTRWTAGCDWTGQISICPGIQVSLEVLSHLKSILLFLFWIFPIFWLNYLFSTGLKQIHFGQSEIWKPDIQLYNNADSANMQVLIIVVIIIIFIIIIVVFFKKASECKHFTIWQKSLWLYHNWNFYILITNPMFSSSTKITIIVINIITIIVIIIINIITIITFIIIIIINTLLNCCKVTHSSFSGFVNCM